ncbi:MAG TPA: hypothetical protein PLM93_10210 [Sulfuricurvum sp.]|nr:MAG: hypothetical protein B7Y30_08875 [Campylobacterales bacterium 16-40-21]OZA02075.1 MAG: hypothetical protein B7X89_10930 [Sulfuricurvum sp. 17-40-25]HQS67542.1 hypothetical protein [Sulfuricurvum sp.]HQT37107.1 hypothetical protein [Sulfuricurvum sp.]
MSVTDESTVTKTARLANKRGFITVLYDHAELQASFEGTLEAWRKSGEEPMKGKLEKVAGVTNGYLHITAKKHFWAEKILTDYKLLRREWEDHGGAEYKAMKKILNEMIKNGEEPSVGVIGEKAGRSSVYLLPRKNRQLYPWKMKLFEETKEAQKAFDKPVLEIPKGYVRLTHQCQPLGALVKEMEFGDGEIIAYKIAAVAFANGKEAYFGSWLYQRWLRLSEGQKGVSTYVDPSSFDVQRTSLVRGAILALNGIPEKSQGIRVKHMEKYINWLNRTENITPKSAKEAEKSYREFTFYLHQVVKGKDPRRKNQTIDIDNFSRKNAGRIQASVLLMLAEAFTNGNAEKIQGMTGIVESSSQNENEAVIDIDALGDALSYYYQFFEQVTDFLLEHKPYPYAIKLLEHDAILVPQIPTYPQIMTPFNGANRFDWRIYFNPDVLDLRNETGVKAAVMRSEVYQRKSPSKQALMLNRAADTLNTFRAAILKANSDYYHNTRLSLGLLAMRAYFMVMMDITGLNDVTLATMPWNDENDLLEEENGDSIKLRNIKHRAGGKVVEFSIQRKFKPSFITFLKLRRFVLDGYSCDTLYFTGTSKNAKLEGLQQNGGFGVYAYKDFQSYYPGLKYFGSRKLRRFKKQWIMKETNGRTYLAAKLLQHTESISQSNYPAQPKDESQKMMANYFDYQHSLTMEIDDREMIGSGACKSHNQPEVQVENAPIKPDCNKKMTCLFCKHYRLMPIKQEIHKVLSMKYVIKEFSKLHAWSQTHFDTVTEPILDRIELLLKALKTKCPETSGIIEDLRKEVDKQNLTSYWQGVHERNWEAVW